MLTENTPLIYRYTSSHRGLVVVSDWIRMPGQYQTWLPVPVNIIKKLRKENYPSSANIQTYATFSLSENWHKLVTVPALRFRFVCLGQVSYWTRRLPVHRTFAVCGFEGVVITMPQMWIEDVVYLLWWNSAVAIHHVVRLSNKNVTCFCDEKHSSSWMTHYYIWFIGEKTFFILNDPSLHTSNVVSSVLHAGIYRYISASTGRKNVDDFQHRFEMPGLC